MKQLIIVLKQLLRTSRFQLWKILKLFYLIKHLGKKLCLGIQARCNNVSLLQVIMRKQMMSLSSIL